MADGTVLSQLGPSVTTYTFNTNGAYSVAATFPRASIPSLSATGTYTVAASKIFVVTRGRSNTLTYAFEGRTLVITNGSDVFRLRRKAMMPPTQLESD